MKYRNKAVTLIEVLICVVLSVILIIGLMNLFGSGLKGSAKTLNLQDNMETANILMAQIEYDLAKATKITVPDWNEGSQGSAQWVCDSKSSVGSIQYTYDYVSGSKDGVHRKILGNNVNIENYFAKNHLIELNFKHFALDINKDQNNDIINEKHGMWVELTVYSKEKDDNDAFTIKRLIALKETN